MNNFEIMAFGIAKDILGGRRVALKAEAPLSVGEMKAALLERYPGFKALASLRIAVNNEYRADDFLVHADDEIAIIPPVAGG